MVTPTPPRLGLFSIALLASVRRLGADATVRAVRDDLTVRLAREVAIPQIHATLPRLLAAGLLTSHEVAARPVKGGRRRTRYEITEAGVAAIAAVTGAH